MTVVDLHSVFNLNLFFIENACSSSPSVFDNEVKKETSASLYSPTYSKTTEVRGFQTSTMEYNMAQYTTLLYNKLWFF